MPMEQENHLRPSPGERALCADPLPPRSERVRMLPSQTSCPGPRYRWAVAARALLGGLLVLALALYATSHAAPTGHERAGAAADPPPRPGAFRSRTAPRSRLVPSSRTVGQEVEPGVQAHPPVVAETASTYTVVKESYLYGTDTLSLTRVTDLRYEDVEDYEMRALSVYRARDDAGLLSNRPVIFFVHGGGWTDGYRSDFGFVARSFTGELGWVTVVIDYRLTSDQVFLADEYCPDHATCETNEISRTKAAWYPDNIHDIAAAFTWTRDNAAVYGGNPDQVFIFGHSAGAHLSTLLATHPDYAATLRPDIRGLIGMSGAFDLKGLGSNELYEATWGPAVNRTFMGGFTDTVALDEASPATYVPTESGLPPFCIVYAETDLPGLTVQNIDFVNLLTTHSVTLTYDRLEGYGHVSEMAAIQSITETPTSLIIDFISGILWPHRIHLPLIVRRL